MLDINLLLLVARECGVQSRENSRLLHRTNLLLVEKIARLMLVTEEEPVLPGRTCGAPLFQESAERSDAGSRPHHDHRTRSIGGRAKIFVGVNKNRNTRARADAIGKERRANAFAPAAERF